MSAAQNVVVMSYDVSKGIGLDSLGVPMTKDYSKTAAVIETVDPDICMLQEVTPEDSIILRHYLPSYAFRFGYGHSDVTEGEAILSKYGFSEEVYKVPIDSAVGTFNRALIGKVPTPYGDLVVSCAHFIVNFTIQVGEAETCSAMLHTARGTANTPAIFGANTNYNWGDHSQVDGHGNNDVMAKFTSPLVVQVPAGLTEPSISPTRKIDYFVTNNVTVATPCHIYDETTSYKAASHKPIWITITMP